MCKLIIDNRPTDAIQSIQATIIQEVEKYYKDYSSTDLMESRTVLDETIVDLKTKIKKFNSDVKKVSAGREEFISIYQNAIKEVNEILLNADVNLNVKLPTTNLIQYQTFREQLTNLNVENISIKGKTIPKRVNPSKLQEMQKELFKCQYSLEFITKLIQKKSKLLQAMMEV